MLLEHLPRESAYVRALLGEYADWTVDTYISAAIADRLGVLIWHNTADGQKGRNPPAPFPRPGDTPPAPPQRTLEELDAILGRRKKKGGTRGG